MPLVLKLIFPADARYLPKTRAAIAGYLDVSGTHPDETDAVILALDEACANVVRHAFPDGAEGAISVAAEIDEDGITVQVEDDGCGFDPYHLDLEAARDGTSGRGLNMIRALMTSVEVESPTPSGGTRLRMHKNLER